MGTLLATCLLAGCGAAVSQPIGTGCPTVAAASARIEGASPSACLVLTGARDILPADPKAEMDLSRFRNKTLLLVYSSRKAISVASLVDIALSGPGGPDGVPVNLEAGDYQLVDVGPDGTLSMHPPSRIDTLRIEISPN